MYYSCVHIILYFNMLFLSFCIFTYISRYLSQWCDYLHVPVHLGQCITPIVFCCNSLPTTFTRVIITEELFDTSPEYFPRNSVEFLKNCIEFSRNFEEFLGAYFIICYPYDLTPSYPLYACSFIYTLRMCVCVFFQEMRNIYRNH